MTSTPQDQSPAPTGRPPLGAPDRTVPVPEAPAGAPPFVVVGESLVDVVVPPVGERTSAPGGSPMNVAVGLARLGVPVLLVTEVGDDENGRLVVDHVRASGVQLLPGAVRPGRRTSTATAHLGEDRAATYEFDLTWELELPAVPEATAGLHVGSLGTVLEPGRRAVLRMLADVQDRTELLVSYDPNVRQGLLPGWEDVAAVAAQADLVKLSDEDIMLLRPGDPVEAAVAELLGSDRTDLVVVTRGGEGASAFTANARVDVAVPATTVEDTVGAGDSFMAALDAVLLEWGGADGLDETRLRVLLEAAARAAAVTVSRRGANPPTRADLPPDWAGA